MPFFNVFKKWVPPLYGEDPPGLHLLPTQLCPLLGSQRQV